MHISSSRLWKLFALRDDITAGTLINYGHRDCFALTASFLFGIFSARCHPETPTSEPSLIRRNGRFTVDEKRNSRIHSATDPFLWVFLRKSRFPARSVETAETRRNDAGIFFFIDSRKDYLAIKQRRERSRRERRTRKGASLRVCIYIYIYYINKFCLQFQHALCIRLTRETERETAK